MIAKDWDHKLKYLYQDCRQSQAENKEGRFHTITEFLTTNFAIDDRRQSYENFPQHKNHGNERVKGDLHGTTLSHATSLRQACDTNCFV